MDQNARRHTEEKIAYVAQGLMPPDGTHDYVGHCDQEGGAGVKANHDRI